MPPPLIAPLEEEVGEGRNARVFEWGAHCTRRQTGFLPERELAAKETDRFFRRPCPRRSRRPSPRPPNAMATFEWKCHAGLDIGATDRPTEGGRRAAQMRLWSPNRPSINCLLLRVCSSLRRLLHRNVDQCPSLADFAGRTMTLIWWEFSSNLSGQELRRC